ncbi:XRE family transcriptional regulator [Streptomyces gamaensis]|uniref:XRE family transcriptional regulator n=1 Tax=Streptomyces gamaensis TaxID=1763542 RepID=A0ABW0YXA5_9ACTN
MSQAEVARSLDVSERWFRDLERGVIPPRLSRKLIDRLAEVLSLGPDEHWALCQYAAGTTPLTKEASQTDLNTVRLLLDRQSPAPAYCTDSLWNIVALNQEMHAWFPWAKLPQANLMHWILTDPEAREILVDWIDHVPVFLAQIRFALACRPDDSELAMLVEDVLREPECFRIWTEDRSVTAYADGRVFRLRLPGREREEVEVVSHVLIPAYSQDLRLVILAPREPACGPGPGRA